MNALAAVGSPAAATTLPASQVPPSLSALLSLPLPAPTPTLPVLPLVTMSPMLMATAGVAAVNVVLLGALTAVWVRNYRTFRTPTVAGLAAFGAVLLVENVAAIYFYVSTRMLYSGDPLATRAVLALRTLELIAVAFLAYVTLQ